MLVKVQKIIQEIVDFISTEASFSTEVQQNGTVVTVTNTLDGNSQTFNGLELYMYREAARELKSNIEFKIANSESSMFVITCPAQFDYTTFIVGTNKENYKYMDDTIHSVFIGEDTTLKENFKYTVLTTYNDGTWVTFGMTPAEFTYVCVFGCKVQFAEDTGAFVFKELVDMSKTFFDQRDAIQ